MIPKDYGLIIKEMGLARLIRIDINEVEKKKKNSYFTSFLGLADEQLFLEKYTSRFYTSLFLSLSLLLSLNFFRPLFKDDISSYLKSFGLHSSLSLGGLLISLWILVHHYLASGGRVGYRL